MVQRIEKIETALEGNFQQLFVNAMAMPNKADAFPELAKCGPAGAQGAGRCGRWRSAAVDARANRSFQRARLAASGRRLDAVEHGAVASTQRT